jgi:DNA-binding CsgD family transcriptional regulator
MAIEKECTQALNALFTFLDNLESVVFWICTPDYQKQIYLASSYEIVWGHPGNIIRSSGLSTWRNTLVLDDFQRNYDEFFRRADIPGASAMVYRVHRPDGELRWIKDTSYTLTDKEGKPAIVTGIAEVLAPQRWEELYKKPIIHVPKQSLLKDCIEILQKEYKLITSIPKIAITTKINIPTVFYFNKRKIKVTRREAECIYYLMQGKTAKETAKILKISPRTVETHLEHVRNKAGCHNKMNLIGKLKFIE